MDFSKLEQLKKQIHIISAIERAATFGGDVWQNGHDQKRTVFQFEHADFEPTHDNIVLKTIGLYPLNPNCPIFIRFRYRNILFRLEPSEFRIFGDRLICSIPTDVMALAMRDSERYVLPFNLDISLSIHRFARSIKETTPGLEVRIIDVSEIGIGILISGANKEFLRPYDHFCIKAIDHKVLHRDIFGTVLYVAPKAYFPKRQDVRVGLSLSTPLNWNTYCNLKKKCRIILSA